MLDFRQHRGFPNNASRRRRWRLLLLVLALGLTAIVLGEARKPDRWRWLTVLMGQRAQEAVAPALVRDSSETARASSHAAKEVTAGRYFPGVKPENLGSVRDDTTFRSEEGQAWFNLLETLDKNDQSALERGSLGRVAFSQLFTQPDVYRGRLVTLSGSIRRAHLLTAPENDSGIKEYYQAWLLSSDRSDTPMIVYLLQLPKGFPTGMEINEPVQVTGFFFKLWAYPGQDRLHTTPAVLARMVRWQPRPAAAEPAPHDPSKLLLWIGLALAASVVIAIFIYTWSRPAPPRELVEPLALDKLTDFVPPSPATAIAPQSEALAKAAPNATDTEEAPPGSK